MFFSPAALSALIPILLIAALGGHISHRHGEISDSNGWILVGNRPEI